MKRYLLSILLLSQTGCAGLLTGWTPNRPSYDQVVSTWVGQSVDTLVNQWGYPTRSFQSPSGNMVYAYERSASYTSAPYQMPSYIYGSSISHGITVAGNTATIFCNTYFEVDDESKTIVRTRWDGNHCG